MSRFGRRYGPPRRYGGWNHAGWRDGGWFHGGWNRYPRRYYGNVTYPYNPRYYPAYPVYPYASPVCVDSNYNGICDVYEY
jgi:hypothetical protein